jgi:alkyl sulfatase BDS1-like metallo-beta-lactamase superfamily hydrolase
VAGENLAWAKETPTAPKGLTDHSLGMTKKVIEIIPGRVYLAVGYQLGYTTLVVGGDGLIFIDPADSVEGATEAVGDLLACADTSLPIKAVIYTHSHPDHFQGVKALVGQEDVDAGRVEIIAQEEFMADIAEQNSVLGPVLGLRTLYTAGGLLPRGPEGVINAGLGPIFRGGQVTLIAPTMLVPEDGNIHVEIAGVKMDIYHTPGDIHDNISTHFPDLKLYHYAEVMQGDNFPNLHTIRGSRYRDPERWYESLDLIRTHTGDVDYLIGSHGLPVFGNAELNEVLTSYRDAIQFTHNQTVRYMNKGLVPDELVEVVKLPDHLANHPRLGEFYGTVDHSVREIYYGLLGFFKSDITEMAKPGFEERAAGYVRMMGGRSNIIGEAKSAIGKKDYGWAADILTWVIRSDPADSEAKQLKAEALRSWGYTVPSINWRYFALTGALELEGKRPPTGAGSTALFGAPDILAAMDPSDIVKNMTVRLKAEDTLNVNMVGAFSITDLGMTYSLVIRKGIAQFYEGTVDGTAFTLQLKRATLNRILEGKVTVEQGLESGAITISGSQDSANEFLAYFEPVENTDNIRLLR